MNTFFLVLFRPVKTFGEIKATGKFSTMSFIVILFLMVLNLILMIPVTEKITTITLSSMPIPENQMETMLQVAHKMRYLQVAGMTIFFIIMVLFYALLLYLFVRITKNKLKYKNILQLFIYSYFIATIGDLINTALLYARGVNAIQNMYDTSLIGLNLFTSIEQAGSTFYTFLSCFTPFQLIYVFLLSIGLKVYTDTKYVKALTISILFWLITILIPILSVYFSQLSVAKSGIM